MSAVVADAPSSLEELLSPVTVSDFLGLLRRRELTYWAGAKSDLFAPLVGWAALRRMLDAGAPPKKPHKIRVTKESDSVLPAEWSTDGKTDVRKLDQLLAGGHSVVINSLEQHVPAFDSICQEIKALTQEGAMVGAIIASAGSAGIGAFNIHYDPEDLVIVQVEGTKRWQVFGPPVTNPMRGMPKRTPPPESDPVFDEVLAPGDALFVPAGYWHHCQSGLSTSVHLGFFFLPPTAMHAVREVFQPLIEEEGLRKPLTRLDGESTIEETQAALKQRLIDKIGAMNLTDFVSRWREVAY